LLRAVLTQGFTQPTPVQAAAVPALLRGEDVVAEAPSGSGKTLAFALPSLALVDPAVNAPQVLIVAPTGALAQQIAEVCESLTQLMQPRPRVFAATAGARLGRQRLQPQMIVATPMKLLDMCGLLPSTNQRGGGNGGGAALAVDQVRVCVLDEADEFLDRPEFTDQVAALVKALPLQCALGFFSATLTWSTADAIARENLVRPNATWVKPGDGLPAQGPGCVRPAIRHFKVNLGGPWGDQDWEARGEAIADLTGLFGGARAVVFARATAERDLFAAGFGVGEAGCRFVTDLAAFKSRPGSVLLATDACARGLDVDGVALVINAEPPRQAASYTQRAGRAGRFGKAGVCVTLVAASREDRDAVASLERELPFQLEDLPSDVAGLPGAGRYQPPAAATTTTKAMAAGALPARDPSMAPRATLAPLPLPKPSNATPLPVATPSPRADLTKAAPVAVALASNDDGRLSQLMERVEALALEAQQATDTMKAELAAARDDAAAAREAAAAATAEVAAVRAQWEAWALNQETKVPEDAEEEPGEPEMSASNEDEEPEIEISFGAPNSDEDGASFTGSQKRSLIPCTAEVENGEWKTVPRPRPHKSQSADGNSATSGANNGTAVPRAVPAAERRLGSARLLHPAVGATYRGLVVTALAQACFLRFGDGQHTAPRDGFLKRQGSLILKPGAWVWVRVAQVGADGKTVLEVA